MSMVLKCMNCDSKFRGRKWRGKPQKYCSKKCCTEGTLKSNDTAPLPDSSLTTGNINLIKRLKQQRKTLGEIQDAMEPFLSVQRGAISRVYFGGHP